MSPKQNRAGLSPIRALLTSFVLALTHISSAVLLAGIANSLVKHTIVGAGRAPAIEWTSRVILIGIGLWLIYRAIRAKPHLQGEGTAAGFFAGLIPCPLTLFVMTLAMSRDTPEAGLAFSFAMLFGVASILGTVAVVAAVARDSLVQMFDNHGMAIDRLSRIFDVIAGAALMTIAVYELSR